MTGMADAMSSAGKDVLVLADGKKILDDDNKKYKIKRFSGWKPYRRRSKAAYLKEFISINNVETIYADSWKSIEYLKNIKKHNNKKIIILGTMNEMGNNSHKVHYNLLNQLDETIYKFVILCGEFYETSIKKLLNPKNEFIYFKNKNKIMQFLKNKIHNNDIILIKCSNSTEINKFTKTLIEKET